MSSADVLARLRRHYIAPGDRLPGGTFLTEVQSARGGSRLDALFLGFVGSRGHHLHGHEIKCSRSDWLRELDRPDKAEWWHARTHRWWVVANGPRVVKQAELPPGWGLLIPSAKSKVRMLTVVDAAIREPIIDFPLLLEIAKKADLLRDTQVRAVIAAEKRRADDTIDAATRDRPLAGDPNAVLNAARVVVLDQLEKALGMRIIPGRDVNAGWRDDDTIHSVGVDTLAARVRDILKPTLAVHTRTSAVRRTAEAATNTAASLEKSAAALLATTRRLEAAWAERDDT